LSKRVLATSSLLFVEVLLLNSGLFATMERLPGPKTLSSFRLTVTISKSSQLLSNLLSSLRENTLGLLTVKHLRSLEDTQPTSAWSPETTTALATKSGLTFSLKKKLSLPKWKSTNSLNLPKAFLMKANLILSRTKPTMKLSIPILICPSKIRWVETTFSQSLLPLKTS